MAIGDNSRWEHSARFNGGSQKSFNFSEYGSRSMREAMKPIADMGMKGQADFMKLSPGRQAQFLQGRAKELGTALELPDHLKGMSMGRIANFQGTMAGISGAAPEAAAQGRGNSKADQYMAKHAVAIPFANPQSDFQKGLNAQADLLNFKMRYALEHGGGLLRDNSGTNGSGAAEQATFAPNTGFGGKDWVAPTFSVSGLDHQGNETELNPNSQMLQQIGPKQPGNLVYSNQKSMGMTPTMGTEPGAFNPAKSNLLPQMGRKGMGRTADSSRPVFSNQVTQSGGSSTSGVSSRVNVGTSSAGNTSYSDNSLKFAHGGKVNGPGGIDQVPARLSAGEYVLPKDTVQAVGVQNLEALRQATHTPQRGDGIRRAMGGYASGGQVNPAYDNWKQTTQPEQPAAVPAPSWNQQRQDFIAKQEAAHPPVRPLDHGIPQRLGSNLPKNQTDSWWLQQGSKNFDTDQYLSTLPRQDSQPVVPPAQPPKSNGFFDNWPKRANPPPSYSSSSSTPLTPQLGADHPWAKQTDPFNPPTPSLPAKPTATPQLSQGQFGGFKQPLSPMDGGKGVNVPLDPVREHELLSLQPSGPDMNVDRSKNALLAPTRTIPEQPKNLGQVGGSYLDVYSIPQGAKWNNGSEVTVPTWTDAPQDFGFKAAPTVKEKYISSLRDAVDKGDPYVKAYLPTFERLAKDTYGVNEMKELDGMLTDLVHPSVEKAQAMKLATDEQLRQEAARREALLATPQGQLSELEANTKLNQQKVLAATAQRELEQAAAIKPISDTLMSLGFMPEGKVVSGSPEDAMIRAIQRDYSFDEIKNMSRDDVLAAGIASQIVEKDILERPWIGNDPSFKAIKVRQIADAIKNKGMRRGGSLAPVHGDYLIGDPTREGELTFSTDGMPNQGFTDSLLSAFMQPSLEQRERNLGKMGLADRVRAYVSDAFMGERLYNKGSDEYPIPYRERRRNRLRSAVE